MNHLLELSDSILKQLSFFCHCSVLSCFQLFVTPWTAVHQTPLPSAVSRGLLQFMSVESVMLSNHLILCHPLLFLQSCPASGYFPSRYFNQFSSVQSLSLVQLFATPWIAAHQASLSITNSRSLLKLMPIESVMPSSHLILGHPLLLLPPVPPSIRVFSNESTLCMRWPKYWSFSFRISPSNEHPGLISFRMDNKQSQILLKKMKKGKTLTK